MAGYNVSYEVCCIFFMVILLVLSVSRKRLGNFQIKLFWLYWAAAFTNLCLDVATGYGFIHFEQVPDWFQYIANTVFFTIQFLLPAILVQYVYYKVQKEKREKYYVPIWIWIPATAGFIIMFTNYWTREFFFLDSTGYHQGRLYNCLYINTVLYSLGGLLYIIRNYRNLKIKQCLVLCTMVLAGVIPEYIQLEYPSYQVSGVGAALAAYIMYFSNENPIIYEDVLTGALTRLAFIFHVQEFRQKKIPEQIFALGLDNFKIINEIYGMECGNYIMQQLVAALQKEYGEMNVFHINGDVFSIVCDEKIESLKVLDKLHSILARKWKVGEEKAGEAELELSACICLIHSDGYGNADVIRVIDYAMERAKAVGKGEFIEVNKKIVEDMDRQTAIEQAIVTAIEKEEFEVYYQPIYDVHKKKFHSMEALARLYVKGYGYVSPEEFIRIAEKNGTILQIGMLVLDEVCRLINDYDLKAKGIEFVEVNLSVVQCMQKKIFDEIQGVLRKHKIDPSMINLEITESAAAYSEERLIQNMARLSLTDITFSLDDYGSGYSNINYLVDLPFSIVKIDKYIVWAAMKKVSSRCVLENSIAMFKDINLKVVTEGIEDQKMLDMVVDMGADYIQGYYFSKPVSKKDLAKCLEEGYIERILEEKN